MSHKDNPLSNPEDYKLYRSRVAQEAINRRWIKAKLAKAEPGVKKTPDLSIAPRVRSRYQRTPKSEIEYGPFKAWMQRFALWLIQQETTPPRDVQIKQANFYSKLSLSPHWLKMLLKRRDVQQCMESYHTDILVRAKAEYEELLPAVVAAQKMALDKALATGDIKQVKQIIESGMDRLWPKKVDRSDAPKEVHIHLGAGNPNTDRLMQAVRQEITLEPAQDVVVTKALPPGESDGAV